MRIMDADVIVVGAGISGCASAAALADGKRRVLILEARQRMKPRLAGELIHPTGVEVLHSLGFMPELHAAGGTDVEGFAVLKTLDSTPTRLPYREIPGSLRTGFAIEHRILIESMRRVVSRRPGVELRLDEQAERLLYDSHDRIVGVATQRGDIHARLVLGCDGRSSKIRTLLKLPAQTRLLSFSAGVLLPDAADELPCPGFGHIFLGAWGPILLYPISGDGTGGDVRCCFDVTQDLVGGPQGAAAHLRASYALHLPMALRRKLLTALERQLPQIVANENVRTQSVVARGAALVGDAGGCAHPLTATGLTIGLVDARRIGQLLAPLGDLDSAQHVDAALHQYELQRYRFVRMRELLADALYEVFRAADPGAKSIQEGIFRYWQRSTHARARSMAFLSGADSDPLRFLREYLQVVSAALTASVLGRTEEGWPDLNTLVDRGRALWGLGVKSLEKLQLVVRILGRELARADRYPRHEAYLDTDGAGQART